MTLDISKMTLREVESETRNMRIFDGGLRFMIEKLILEIERLEKEIQELKVKK